MRNALAIAHRDLVAYLVSPTAYIVMAIYLGVMGILFSVLVAGRPGAEASLRYMFGNAFSALILVISGPLITMRQIAEEKRSGTIELLLTAPVRVWEVVLGKYLAVCAVYAIMLAATAIYPFWLTRFGRPDTGVLLTTYLGAWLLGMAVLALGLLTSALTQSQALAAFLGIGLGLVLTFGETVARAFPSPVASALASLGLFSHFFDFLRGVIDTRDLVYYLSVIACALFLTVRALEARRWR